MMKERKEFYRYLIAEEKSRATVEKYTRDVDSFLKFAEGKELEDLYREKIWDPDKRTMTYIGPNGTSISFSIKGDHESYWLNNYEVWNDLGQCIHIQSDKRICTNDMSQDKLGNVRLVKRVPKSPTNTEPTLFDALD